MEIIDIRVENLSPLLQSNPAAMKGHSEELGKKKIPTAEEDAEAGCYRLDSGQLYHPTVGFRACLIRAASGRRIGKVSAATVAKGAVFAMTEETPLETWDGSPIKEYETDIRRVVIRSSKAAILRARPKIMEWAATVSFEIDEDFITETHVRELLGFGGRLIGVGDYRPEKSGPFGRFRVV